MTILKPIRFILRFEPERGVGTTEVVNYAVFGETPDIARIDEPKERNFASIDGLMNALKAAGIPEQAALAIRRSLERGESASCEVTEEQADAVHLGL